MSKSKKKAKAKRPRKPKAKPKSLSTKFMEENFYPKSMEENSMGGVGVPETNVDENGTINPEPAADQPPAEPNPNEQVNL